MATWTQNGLIAQDLSFYKTQLQQAFQAAFGNSLVLDDETPQGVLIQRLAELLYNADMDGVEVNRLFNSNTISGIYLDYLGSWRGFPRLSGSPQLVTLALTSQPGSVPYSILAGTSFTIGSDSFTIINPVNISDYSPQNIVVTYTSNGDSQAQIGDLATSSNRNILNLEVTNLTSGSGPEDDLTFRSRLQQTFNVANNTIAFVQNLLLASNIVRLVGANYNDTDGTVDTLPPYTTEFLVVGIDGIDQNFFNQTVASIILNNKVPGSPTFGNTLVQTTDIFGADKTVMFTVPDAVPIQIQVNVARKATANEVDLANVDAIKATMAQYVNSLTIGAPVSFSEIVRPAISDNGFDMIEFRMKAQADSTWIINSNLSVGTRQYASTTTSDIEIGVNI